ncbi:helix-turn-helix domain-containing protein [Caldanaerobius polysaccharolyticus]|uniref:helix-turn-helix domain-containing protein n=1 Tax=Caldanaerobius polysaccharolyticus TaxID=44256 RepID=UPI000479FA62|nr:helix-turn-helix transcriptional regulator [Caldanaerobius polysaccharolyticus]
MNREIGENTLGKKIRMLRKKAGLTQKQFGDIFNIAKSTVSQYESGKSRPDDDTKKKIARYFGVSLDWLLGLIDDEYVQSHHLLYFKENRPIDLNDILTYPNVTFNGLPLSQKEKSDIVNFIKYVVKKR